MTLIVSAFPGTGKTYYYDNHPENISVLDSDSSKFSWTEPGVANPDFPRNYIDHILMKMGCVDVILVSSHRSVRDALLENEIPFWLAYPRKTLKWEYLYRFYGRGNPDSFIQMMYENWDAFMEQMDEVETSKLLLSDGQYLSEFLEKMI